MVGSGDADRKDLEDARRELAEIHGRPFDVDKTLAAHRARQERDRMAQKAVEQKLEAEHRATRARRHEIRAREIEREKQGLEEEEWRVEEAKRKFEKQQEESKQKKEKRIDGEK